MLEWIGGGTRALDLSIPLFGLVLFLAVKWRFDPHRSWYYFVAALLCWVGFDLVIGLYSGTLVSIPTSIGLSTAILFWTCCMTFFGLALLTVWRDRTA
ncbi:hypothetical protein [Natrinema salsiterrestre]|uniref:Uncharacterized protein n=1 Tax=Natrinema salsiterrestre TaxID=2950540 RepID=A0A9Q4Q0M8_9EURY|nr:hypothetical protein [Natrinema salsiterrestre]MDF9744451.1 hypothetical protein [Natrinema salsiterrestre]